MNLDDGSLFAVDVGAKAFEHLGRDWIVCVKVLGTYTVISKFDGEQTMVVVSVCDPVFDKRPIDHSRCAYRMTGEVPMDWIESESFELVGVFPLSSEEENAQKNILQLIEQQKEKVNRNLNGMTQGAIRIFGEKRSFQEDLNLPRLEHSLDCDIEYASHCLHCGGELNDNIARCPDCKKIRHGFELIERFSFEWQELSAPDVFGKQVMTDVQDPETGSWIGAFSFLEFYLEDMEESGEGGEVWGGDEEFDEED